MVFSPAGLQTKFNYVNVFLIPSFRTTCPTYLNSLYLIIVIKFVKEYKF